MSRLCWAAGVAMLMLSGCEGGEQKGPGSGSPAERVAEVESAQMAGSAVDESGSELPAGSGQPEVEPFSQPVTFELTAELRRDRRLMVSGTTNLPHATRLQVLVNREASGMRWQERTEVRQGHFEAGPFGPGSGLPDGDYGVTVNLPPVSVQPADVRKRLGEEGVNLSGPLVSPSPHGLGKIASITRHFAIGTQPRQTSDQVEIRALEP
ncbi:MAG TPA: hypothetical protein VK991_15610 [Halomonas sp.]|nr:hypothetical protein [Halomonas sp.]